VIGWEAPTSIHQMDELSSVRDRLSAAELVRCSQWRIVARRPRRPLTKRASTSMLVPTSTGLYTSETRGRLRGVGSNVRNATKCVLINTIAIVITTVLNCMDFIYSTEFEEVKILCWQL